MLPDVTYYFRVRAFNPVGESAPSNVVWYTSATVAPDAPTNLVAEPVPPYPMVRLSWEDNSFNENAFVVRRKTSDTTYFWPVATVPPNVTQYTDVGVERDTDYWYVVYASNSKGWSGPSNEVHVHTALPTSARSRWRLYR
jgi:hypothetical protein